MTGEKQATFNLDRDYPVIGNGLLRRGADHDKAAIAAFVASGKKQLILWHASGDNLLSPNDQARNYATMTQLVKNMGIADPSVNTRLFLVPANTHGAGSALTQVGAPTSGSGKDR